MNMISDLHFALRMEIVQEIAPAKNTQVKGIKLSIGCSGAPVIDVIEENYYFLYIDEFDKE